MSLVALIVFIVLMALLIWIAQQVPYPWNWVCYALAILFLVIAILQVLGIGDLHLGHMGAMGFLFPKPKPPPPPPPAPSMADTTKLPPQEEQRSYQSLVSTTPTGLQRKATVQKRSLLGGTST